MRLHSLKARCFRSLEELSLIFSESYCTISGRNNAGKSSVIRLLTLLFRTSHNLPIYMGEDDIDYSDDKTQWIKSNDPIVINYSLSLSRDTDPALISFIEKIAGINLNDNPELIIEYSSSIESSTTVSMIVNNQKLDEPSSKEIDKRIKDSRLLFLYNSTTPHEQYFYGRNRRRMFYDFVISDGEKRVLENAGKQSERKIRKFAKQHTHELSQMLGRLTEKYEVEVAPPEGFAIRRMPLGINLRDKHVKVPLDDWGSGTQNRTHILMAILQANRIKTTETPDEKITPIVVIEEPESFLHPSAQSEFGRMLRDLSNELGIQIIATTHSPYMLNLENPSANILLTRERKRNMNTRTSVVDTDNSNWMAPFAEHLGISSDDFSSLRTLFNSKKKCVLLVEGKIDQLYFEHLQSGSLNCDQLRSDIDVVPYGGKDTLKNTLLFQFLLRNFENVYITFDLDAENEATQALKRLGLEVKKNYMALGLDNHGKDCIEGLLPQRLLSLVNGRETDLVMQLGSQSSQTRKDAKNALKMKYLDEFRNTHDFSVEELKEFNKVIRQINSNIPK